MAEWLDEEWDTALDDARIPPEDAALVPWPGAGPNAAEAMWFRPWLEITADDLPDEAHRSAANADPHLQHHRVCVWPDGLSRPIVGALMRHELEHARQWERHHAHVADLHGLTLALLSLKGGGLYGCKGELINPTPEEQDCNAAAATYLRKHHPQVVKETCDSRHRRLACSLVGPQDLDTLPARMIAWMFVQSDLADLHADAAGFPFGDLLDMCIPGGRAMWAALQDAAQELPPPA